MTFDEALAGAGDPDLHPTIRSKYVELLIGNAFHHLCMRLCIWTARIMTILLLNSTSIPVLFVDVGDNHSVLETLANSFVR